MKRHALNAHDSGLPALHRHAARGALSAVQAALDDGHPLLELDATMGASALHYAAQGGSVSVVDLLLQRGALVNLQAHSHGMTPLMVAVWHRQTAVVEHLLAQPEIDVDIRARTGATAEEMIGGGSGPYEVEKDKAIRAAFTHWRQARPALSIITALEDPTTAEKNKTALIRSLLSDGADPNEVAGASSANNPGHSALLIAARDGLADVVAALLAAGADMTLVGNFMRAHPAHKAAYMGRAEVLRHLCAHPDFGKIANVQGPFNGYTALHDAAWHGHIEATRVLLEAGVRTDLTGYDGLTPARLAEHSGYPEVARLIDTYQG